MPGTSMSSIHTLAAVDMARLLPSTILRLCLAAVLGGVIGLERELKHKAAGLRTNMFICFGAAMFTILSVEMAGEFTGDHTRIAAQIIPGIGFIGAGTILHARGGISGITTAATIFVVASIGMAVGAGLYLPAIFATLLIFLALEVLGWLETRFNLKPLVNAYEVVGATADSVITAVNDILDEKRKIMRTVQVAPTKSAFRVQFSVEGTTREQREIFQKLRQTTEFQRVEALGQAAEQD